MSETSTLIGYSGRTIDREELSLVPTPSATETHRPIPHHEVVGALMRLSAFVTSRLSATSTPSRRMA